MTPRAMRFWFYTTPTDMRKGFDGLSGLVRDHCALDPLTGDVYVFISRARMHIKLLYWDGDGFVMYYKRLEQGRFDFPLGTSATVGIDHLRLGKNAIEALLKNDLVRELVERRALYNKGIGWVDAWKEVLVLASTVRLM